MRLSWRSLLVIAGLALAAAPAHAGKYSFGFGYSGDDYSVGIGYTSRGHHGRHYRPSYCPPPRSHYRPTYRPTYRPSYRPVYRPYYRPPVYCPPPRYHRPRHYYSYPRTTISFGVGYTSSHYDGYYASSSTYPVTYSQPNTYAYEPAVNADYAAAYSSGARGSAKNWTSYAETTRDDDRVISREATYYKDRLVDSRTTIVDNGPKDSDIQPGTNYSHDGRLVYPPRQTQQVAARVADQPKAETSSNQSTGERPAATPASTQGVNNTAGVQILNARLDRPIDEALRERLEMIERTQTEAKANAAQETEGVTVRRVERVAVSNRAGAMSPNARPSGGGTR